MPVSHSQFNEVHRSTRLTVTLFGCLGIVLLGGCIAKFRRGPAPRLLDQGPTNCDEVSLKIEYPDVNCPPCSDSINGMAPFTIRSEEATEYMDLSLLEVVELALQNSDVLRDLGGNILSTPDNARTRYDPAIAETDAQRGVAAALSAYDAEFSTGLFFEENDRAVNNEFFGGGTRILVQDLGLYEAQIRKRAATGSLFTLRQHIDYDANNAPGNRFDSAWNTDVEAEFRHPLLQGGGVNFNRIAGPASVPGFLNGVLLARINTDLSLADFEIAVRDYVSDVELAYWEVYFAYRDLEAKKGARDRALETWRRIKTLYDTGRRGGEAEKEAQARERYYRMQADVQDALTGQLMDRTRTIRLRGTGGVYDMERQLRMLCGLPINAGQLIRPTDEPTMANVMFPWHEIESEAIQSRPELRRQKWRIKQRELELCANKNFLMPTLDVVGRYRWRGFGDDLLDPDGDGAGFDNAFANLTGGDFQEWQMGVEYSAPLGFRQAHSAVRNSELQLRRARALLQQQRRDVVYGLSNAVAEKDRAYEVAETNFNRRNAALEQLDALETIYDDADAAEKTRLLDTLLDAQQRLADAESRYFRALAQHAVAIKQVHFEKGSLLAYNGVFLAEGGSPRKAYRDAAEWRKRSRRAGNLINYIINKPDNVSRGCSDVSLSCNPAGFHRVADANTSPPETFSSEKPSVGDASTAKALATLDDSIQGSGDWVTQASVQMEINEDGIPLADPDVWKNMESAEHPPAQQSLPRGTAVP